MTDIQGRVEPGFEPVRELLEQQFAQGLHIGAGVAVYQRGRPVVNLWGGLADEDSGRPWDEGTMAVSFSTTKGLTALCLHLLADRGLVSYDDPVSKYWPEFAANGKESVTVYHLLTHQAGVPQLPDGITTGTLTDWDRMVRDIAALTPVWTPGTATGYHAITFGYLVGEVVRRIDGRSVGAFFRDEVAKPLGISELHIGAPASAEPKIATLKSRIDMNPSDPEMAERMRQVMGPGSLAGRALGMNLPGNMNDLLNSPVGRQAEIPAVNGVMSARGLARMYACLAGYGKLDGTRIVGEGTVRKMSNAADAPPRRGDHPADRLGARLHDRRRPRLAAGAAPHVVRPRRVRRLDRLRRPGDRHVVRARGERAHGRPRRRRPHRRARRRRARLRGGGGVTW